MLYIDEVHAYIQHIHLTISNGIMVAYYIYIFIAHQQFYIFHIQANIAHFLQHPVLYFPDVVYNTRKQRAYLRFSEEHQVLHSSSPLLATSINSNYYKPFKALVLLML